MADESNFEKSDSGASKTYPVQCSALRKGGFVVLKGFPCKIVEMSTSKTGKHGHAKIHLVGIDIFTGKKYEDLSPSTHNMDVPEVTRADYQLVDISDDGFVSLLKQDGTTKDDLRLPEGELGEKLKEEFEKGGEITVSVLSALGMEQIVSYKTQEQK
jgi:translation initiation factor 5A